MLYTYLLRKNKQFPCNILLFSQWNSEATLSKGPVLRSLCCCYCDLLPECWMVWWNDPKKSFQQHQLFQSQVNTFQHGVAWWLRWFLFILQAVDRVLCSVFHSMNLTPNYLYPVSVIGHILQPWSNAAVPAPYFVSPGTHCMTYPTWICFTFFTPSSLFFSCSSWHSTLFLVSQVYRLVTLNLCQTWPWTKS